MPANQEEKEAFFAQLEGLDESTESEEDVNQYLPRKRPRLQEAIDPNSLHKHGMQINMRQVPNARELAKAKLPALRRAITEDQPISPDLDSAKHTLPPIRRTNSEPDPPSRTRKVNPAKASGSLFEGLTFFFIPNDDVVKVRKLRIQSAIAQGAKWARKLDSSISHIIVDATIDAAGVSKVIKDKVDVTQVVIVKDTWLIESLSHKNVRDPSQGRFQLKGASMVFGKKTPSTLREPSKKSVAVSTVAVELHEPTEKANEVGNEPGVADELSKILHEMNTASYLPFDEELDLDEILSFSSGDEQAGDEVVELSTMNETARVPQENRGFACMEAHTGKSENPNNRTIDILQQMTNHYDRTGDSWRMLAYRKGIAALRKQNTLVSTKKQALAIFGIGTRLADKIEEIVMTDRLARLDSVLEDPDEKVLQLFMGIHEVGYTQAKLWMSQGYRTIDDLQKHAKLSANQQIGIDHYDDFQLRIPRVEVELHGAIVQRALSRTNKKLQAIIGGSYRRGLPVSGDIDIMVTHPTADLSQLREWVFDNVVPHLFTIGFLKCTLATSRGKAKEQKSPVKQKSARSDATTTKSNTPMADLAFARSSSSGTKFLGASQIPTTPESPRPPWRRIDLLLVPASSLGANLIYFTGNDIFNRSMRLLASRKGMRLNQHGLYKNVMRGSGRVKETEGELVEGRSEKKIFQILGVPWRPPEERRC